MGAGLPMRGLRYWAGQSVLLRWVLCVLLGLVACGGAYRTLWQLGVCAACGRPLTAAFSSTVTVSPKICCSNGAVQIFGTARIFGLGVGKYMLVELK